MDCKNCEVVKELREAYRLRIAQCINGDPDDPPTDPLTYEPTLQRWCKVLKLIEAQTSCSCERCTGLKTESYYLE